MDDEKRQYQEQMKNNVEKLSDAAKDKAKKEIIKKIIAVIGVKGVAIIILAILACSILAVVFLASALYLDDLDINAKATSAKETAIGNEALGKILKMEYGKYKIEYTDETGEVVIGKEAIKSILEDNNMNFEDFNDEEIECLYKCLKAEWATTYPNLGENVDNKDVDSEYVQGVITIKRGKSDGNIVNLTYKPYEEFVNIKDATALNYFSMKDGNIVVANWSSNETIYIPSDSMPDDIKSQYVNTGEQISITEIAINYRSMIGIHTVPFEFLLSLLVNTEDVEFVSDLADSAFDSTIEITVYDNMTEITTIETEHTNERTTYKKWVDYYITTTEEEITAGGTQGHRSSYNTYETDKEITSAERKEVDYTLTTKRITKNNSYVVGLTNVSSWLADIKNEYKYLHQDGQKENLGLGEPYRYGPEEQEKEDISITDSEVVAFKNANQSTRTTVDSYNNSTHKTTKTCTITRARRQGTLEGLNELTENTSQTNEYKYESGAKQTSNIGAKFKEVYDKHPGAQAQLDCVSSWLFELLEESSSTVDYVSIMKYLLYVCTGEDYGVTDIEDILNLYNSTYCQTTSSVGDIICDYIRTWENISLYNYYKGISSSSKYASGEYYNVYMEGTISNIAYGIVLNRGWNDDYFTKRGVSATALKSYSTEGQPFKELTGKEIEEVFEEMINEQHKSKVEIKCKDIDLEDNQICALTSIHFQYGNIGNFVDAYNNYYMKGDKEGFKDNFKTSTGYQPLKTDSTNNKEKRISSRVKANWDLFDTGVYTTSGGTILNPVDYSNNVAGDGNIIECAEKIHTIIETKGYYYGHGGYTLDRLKNGKEVNCCSYVSWVLYEAGYINTIYNGCSRLQPVLEANPNFERINSMSEMKAGDIVFCKTSSESGGGLAYANGKYIHHVQIYAGNNQWYNAGSTEAIQRDNPYSQGVWFNSSKFVVAYRAKGNSESGGTYAGNSFKDGITGKTFKIYTQSGNNTWYPARGNTLAYTGCGPVSCCIISSGYGYNQTPEQLVSDGRNYSYVENIVKYFQNKNFEVIQERYISDDKVIDYLKKGYKIVVRAHTDSGVKPISFNGWQMSNGGHFYTILGYDQSTGEVFIGDPVSRGVGWVKLSKMTGRINYISIKK